MTLPNPTTIPPFMRGVGLGRPKSELRLFIEEVATAGQIGAAYRFPKQANGGGINEKVRAEFNISVTQRTTNEEGVRAEKNKAWVYVTRNAPAAS